MFEFYRRYDAGGGRFRLDFYHPVYVLRQMAHVRIGRVFLVTVIALFAVRTAEAETFRWATTSDPQTMDPHAVNAAPTTSFLNNIYEGLVRRNATMDIEPSLAVRWEPLRDETGWRFYLREGVVFHGGESFTAADVLFSYERGISETSDVTSWFAPVERVRVVDEYTIDFITTAPNPLFPDSIANFMIMSRSWSVENGAVMPASQQQNHATRNANGTGPFELVSRSPGVETRLAPNRDWWDTPVHNVTEAIYTPIENQSTALSALLSGEIDMISPVPLQDVRRVEAQRGFQVLSGLETRVIMLGFGHEKDRLDYSDDVSGENPFQNRLVRQAVYQAIDVDTINRVIMRNMSEPADQLLPAGLSGYSDEHSGRLPYDPDASRRLLRRAGYPDGFSFGFMCTNDRYLNDEQVCRAVTSMLAEVGLDAQLTTMPVRNYWNELRADNYDMYLLGWSPGTFDAEHPIRFLVATPNAEARLGSWNYGGYSNERVDELLPRIQSELDADARQAMLDEVAGIIRDDVVYVPLYTQPLIWATRDNIDLVQRPDNFFMARWVTVN